MQFTGLGLFLGGCLIALVSAAKLPADNGWPDTWPIYFLSLAVAGVGLYLFYMADKRAEALAVLQTKSTKKPRELLEDLLARMRELSGKLPSLSIPETATHIDSLLDEYVLPFTTIEEQLLHELGPRRGAEVLTAAARGERLLNRVWSAAGDENPNEVRRSYKAALAAFEYANDVCNS